MPIRVRYLVAGLSAVAAAVILVLVLRGGGDAPNGETVLGMRGRGFPLRGSLATDDKAIAGAVSAWRERAKEDEDSDEDDDTAARRRPDEDDDVVVLWAGRVDERTDVVMLEGGELVAEMRRGTIRNWYVSGESSRDRNGTPGMPVGAGHSVVVPTGERWRSVDASDSAGLVAAGDGLFKANSSDQEGFILPESGARSADDRVSIYVAGEGGRFMSQEAFAKLEDALAAGYGRALWTATHEAQRNVSDELEKLSQVPRELRAPQPFEVVWTGRLPDRPHAAIIAQGRDYVQAVALGYAEPPDEEDPNDDPNDGAQLLGIGDEGRSGSNQSEKAVAGQFLELDDIPYLVLAGTGVETLHALVGDREVSRRAPAAVIDARQFGRVGGPPPDTVIYGRTADGDVIAPLNTR